MLRITDAFMRPYELVVYTVCRVVLRVSISNSQFPIPSHMYTEILKCSEISYIIQVNRRKFQKNEMCAQR